MPGRHEDYVYTFNKPGTYRVALPRVLRRRPRADAERVDGDRVSPRTSRRHASRFAPGPDLDSARSLALRYLIASTAILGASRHPRPDARATARPASAVFRPGWWYAIMTAHGLGAFVGWAAFAVMGLAFWVLAQVGLPGPAVRARARGGSLGG